jgi:phosphoserine phosphatase
MKLFAFDFDQTLIHTMGTRRRQENSGFVEGLKLSTFLTGWRSKKESMEMSVFYPCHAWTGSHISEAISDEENLWY